MDNPMMRSERPKDECGVFGLFKHPEAAKITYFGLYALQHRGQESAGISVNRGINDKIFSHKGMGLVPDIFDMSIDSSLISFYGMSLSRLQNISSGEDTVRMAHQMSQHVELKR